MEQWHPIRIILWVFTRPASVISDTTFLQKQTRSDNDHTRNSYFESKKIQLLKFFRFETVIAVARC